jgi:hypothetical protein
MDEEALKADMVRRAVQDPAFCAALKADPKGTVERTLGQPLPDALAVEVLQESAQRIYLVLPLTVGEAESAMLAGQSAGGEALDDAALEEITGGVSHGASDFRYDGALNRALSRRSQRNKP